ncbi:uncharacterized protein LOC122058467 [Macadamia integrifolia]|uniref:uncharacterized protein LOC122058467 n=1 Tax=Macadamia integrifolia TaxID=60698 RepID=UPI001C5281CB|nr:uncharacterized protein LOC122058467 [Macadamia integrifolia]
MVFQSGKWNSSRPKPSEHNKLKQKGKLPVNIEPHEITIMHHGHNVPSNEDPQKFQNPILQSQVNVNYYPSMQTQHITQWGIRESGRFDQAYGQNFYQRESTAMPRRPQEFQFIDFPNQVITGSENRSGGASNSPIVNVPIQQNVSLDLTLGRGTGSTYEQPDLTLRLGRGGSGNNDRAQVNRIGPSTSAFRRYNPNPSHMYRGGPSNQITTAPRAPIPTVYAPYYGTLGLHIDPFIRAFLGRRQREE